MQSETFQVKECMEVWKYGGVSAAAAAKQKLEERVKSERTGRKTIFKCCFVFPFTTINVVCVDT